MADSKITALASISTSTDPAVDPLVIVDVSDTSMAASGTSKKVTVNQILGSGGTATLASATITGALDAARLNVTGATIPANGVYLGSANNLSFSTASTLGMTLDASGRLIRGGSTADTLATDAATMVNIGNFSVQNAATTGTYIAIKPDVANQNLNINIDARTGGVPDLRFLFGSAEKFRMTAGGNINVQNGNVVMTTSGTGIDFSATASGSGTMTSELLADYEEGAFSPTVIGGTIAGVGVYGSQIGRYTKVGNLVTVQVYLDWSAHTGTGDMSFGGLPFTTNSSAGTYSAATFGYVHNIALTASNILTGWANVSATSIFAYQTPVGGGAATAVPIDTSGTIILALTYRV